VLKHQDVLNKNLSLNSKIDEQNEIIVKLTNTVNKNTEKNSLDKKSSIE